MIMMYFWQKRLKFRKNSRCNINRPHTFNCKMNVNTCFENMTVFNHLIVTHSKNILKLEKSIYVTFPALYLRKI